MKIGGIERLAVGLQEGGMVMVVQLLVLDRIRNAKHRRREKAGDG